MDNVKLPIGVFHPGTQHSWQTARALQEIDDLGWYATAIFWAKDRLPYNLIPWLPTGIRERVTAELRRFHHPMLDLERVETFAGTEWAMRLSARLGFRRLARRLQLASNRAFARPVERLIDKKPVRAVWGYDQSSLEVFRAARNCGVKTILDRTIGHPIVHNRILSEIYNDYPEFFTSAPHLMSRQFIERAEEEHSLADTILVGSQFCSDTLTSGEGAPVDPRKVRILPYCYDEIFFPIKRPRSRFRHPIRFLFTGLAGPRKGIHLILKVFERIPETAATLTIVGDLQIPRDTFAKYSDRVTVRHTVPRPDVAALMESADCLLFPSYFEGAGIVLYEAMASGLSIIQSKHADVVLSDNSELLMTDVTEEELHRCVLAVIDRPELLEQQSLAGLASVRKFSYRAYRERVAEVARLV
ncbi:glycosyltransferase family 4 protein [Bradyrhizobium sp. UNPF46]|uniref:glycosyltransferase family 4 protein n=1 Tax=Bradyrhizobium sp. UNPF46 TaxID=1141168 RepID=UPI00115336C8|nr:glycosyltransferase family 4 protein [Bradyrhizobium sp. UNPF46]